MLVIGTNGLLFETGRLMPDLDVLTPSMKGKVPVINGLRLLQFVKEADVGISDEDKTNFA